MMKKVISMIMKMVMRVILSLSANNKKRAGNRRLVLLKIPNRLPSLKKSGLKSQTLQNNNLQF
jgi:hypothetical protein